MTDQLEVVSSPMEALQLLEAGNHSPLDVEAFRCFAKLCTGKEAEKEVVKLYERACPTPALYALGIFAFGRFRREVLVLGAGSGPDHLKKA